MRSMIPLSSDWRFRLAPRDESPEAAAAAVAAAAAAAAAEVPVPGEVDGGARAGGWARVDLPHTLLELPFNHFDETSYQRRGTYLREFRTPELPAGGRAFLDFEGVAVSCEVWLNGVKVGAHRGPYTPFSADITDALEPGGTNRLLVEVDAREDPEVPPFGGVVDYLVYGGIYRAVWLRVVDAAYIEDLHARPSAAENGEGRLSVELTLGGAWSGGAEIAARLSKGGAEVARASVTLRDVAKLRERPATLEFPALGGVRLWDIDDPELYDLEIVLRAEGREIDRAETRIGFRTARFTDKGFYLNGRRVFLRGLNRHQSWPYAGYAMGPGAQRRDAEILKKELGVTIVRASHYPQSRHFLDACDELGLLVFEELPGWQHIGDAAWKDKALADLGDMLRRDRNHPCIAIWGARINESKDDDDFYKRTNALASRLDPDRQRGGVRNFRRSSLLEDVYTYNDFTHDGGKAALAPPRAVKGAAKRAPYLVTEHNGHMYPTKRYDQEERLAEQARRHARVLDAAMGDPGISGAIGWCAFDYNTHKDFGSGDRICYHGVSDMFRIPKRAAALYASQTSPRERIVLEAASVFAKGERSAARTLPVEVYTNCDAVDLYRAGEKVGRFFPDRPDYPHLEHPPVLIDDVVGDRINKEGFAPRERKIFLSLISKVMTCGAEGIGAADRLKLLSALARRRMSFADAEALVMKYGLAWGRPDDSLELVGIVDGKEAARRTYGPDARAERLELAADAPTLKVRPGDEWDAVRLVARIADQYGNTCPFAFEPLRIEVSGAGRLIGPPEVSLVGGAVAFWVASTGAAGEVRATVSTFRFGEASASLAAEVVHG